MKQSVGQISFTNTIDSAIVGTKIYTLVKRGNLFLIREISAGDKTISMHANEEAALERFSTYKHLAMKGGEQLMSGKDKFDEVGEKLKAERQEKEEQAIEKRETVRSELAAIESNPELLNLYRENARVGSENIGGTTPLLRIHTASSTANELSDGSYPTVGNYFYAPTKEQFKEITCHILTISRGFYVLQENKDTGEKKEQFNQLVGGVIIDGPDPKPFLMYISGLKCQPVWRFGKDVSEYTRAGIPMFVLTARMTTEQVKTEKYGMKWVPSFEIVKENSKPILVLDLASFNELRQGTLTLNETINAIIDKVEVNRIENKIRADTVVTEGSVAEDTDAVGDLF